MRPWTDQELDVLRQCYPSLKTADLAGIMGRSPGSVHQMARKLGLHKSAEFHASMNSGRIQRGRTDPRMLATQFKPGQQPWNKGTHWVAGGRSAETRFKKGQMSGAAQHNYVPIGSYRINRDGHLERKVTDDPALVPSRRWTPVYRLVWEAENGPIADGYLVRFKAGMRTSVLEEITTDRLECISKAENARRNHPRNKSPELAKLVQLKGAITRQVNRITKEAQERAA